MILSPKRGNGGHITSYTLNVGSKEARECGFLNDDKTSKPIRKIVDAEHKRIIFELDLSGDDDCSQELKPEE